MSSQKGVSVLWGGTRKALFTLLFIILSAGTLHADILVIAIEEKKLPYDLSPNNYDLSPSNYSNSVSNHENSSSNYDNSSSNYDNSTVNSKNSASSDRSILVEDNGKLFYYGYYVTNKNGVTNFFSPKGNRIFYAPKSSQAIYHGEKGFFCGLIAMIEGEIRLALTETGQRVLFLGQ